MIALNNDITGPADSLLEDAQRLLSQPTATEMSRLTYETRIITGITQEDRDIMRSGAQTVGVA